MLKMANEVFGTIITMESFSTLPIPIKGKMDIGKSEQKPYKSGHLKQIQVLVFTGLYSLI